MREFVQNSVPSVRRARTKIHDPWTVKTSMSCGKVYPIKWQEVLPGDDFSETMSFVLRQTNPYIRTPLEQIYLDLYAFFVPGRLVQDNFEEVFGVANPSSYSEDELATIAGFQDVTTTIQISSRTVGDYLGLPVGTIGSLTTNASSGIYNHIQVLPFRCFAKIYNRWWRDQNTIPETYVYTNATAQLQEQPNNLAWSATNYTGQLPYARKLPDYFVVSVPSPLKGPSVLIPLQGASPGNLFVPLTTSETVYGFGTSEVAKLRYDATDIAVNKTVPLRTTITSKNQLYTEGVVGTNNGTPSDTGLTGHVDGSNLGIRTGITVDTLRMAMQRQLMLYADTIYGSRYPEYILGHYGVSNGDARMQDPEYITGKRFRINNQDVAQTSAGVGYDSEDGTIGIPLGTVAANSHTVGSRAVKYFKAFTEHGYLFWVGCLRYRHSYQQGVDRKWMRRIRDDIFDPLYAHIAYQPVYTRELYASSATNVFGYGEAWREYKQTPPSITGQMRSGVENSLDVYHFGDYYSTAPVIGQQFTLENAAGVERALSVEPDIYDQFTCDFYCDSYKTRVMPLYSTPGYMDHWFKG